MVPESPQQTKQDAPALVESPGSIVGDFRQEAGPSTEYEVDTYGLHVADDSAVRDQTALQELLLARIHSTMNRIPKSKQERRRYQVGGLVALYLLIMYLCSWSVIPSDNATCPAQGSPIFVLSLKWRLARGRRPVDTCALDEAIDEHVEAIHKDDTGNGGIFVRLKRPITFLQGGNRWSRSSSKTVNEASSAFTNFTNETEAFTESTAKPIEAQSDKRKEESRWVALRYGRGTWNPFLAIWRFFLRHFVNPRIRADEALLQAAQSHVFAHAFSLEPLLSDNDMDFLEAWSDRLTDENPGWHRRVAKVAWGGRSKWWHPVYPRSSFYPLETVDGANLLFPYYQAMQPFMDSSDNVRFPHRQCASGCDTQVAILSTLEWREGYQPWLVTPETIEENIQGWVYAHGLSKPSPFGRHGLVWLRLGQHTMKDWKAYKRAILHSVDQAIAAALRAGRVGRVNIVIDAEGYEWSKIPDFREIKQIFAIFQDHYPGRLGAVFLCNMSTSAEILFSILKPLLGKEVLEKMYVLSKDTTERNQQLESVISPVDIPSWLGGASPYKFSTKNYYESRFLVGDDNQTSPLLD